MERGKDIQMSREESHASAERQSCVSNAATLASRFVEAALDQSHGKSETINSFRAVLLSATLQHAWRYSQHYRAVLPDSVASGSFPRERLEELPILTRAQLAENPEALRTSDEAGVIQSTTGTTGKPVSVYRTDRETTYLKQFQSAVQAILHGSHAGPEPLILNIANSYHGTALDLPRRGHMLSVSLFDAVLLEQVIRWLTTDHAIPGVAPRISIITGVYHMLQWLTWMLKERTFEFDNCNIERLYPVGGYVTSRWKALMEQAWGAEVIPVYSMVEVFTHSNLCTECGAYHFLPNVIPELVSPVDHGPLVGSVGELVLTALFPFQQGQPVIRYATRDMFRLDPGGCQHREGFRFVGRVDHSWILPCAGEAPVVAGSAEMIDLFDSIAEARRIPFLQGLPGVRGEAEIGRPSCGMQEVRNADGVPRLRFTVELRYDPFLFPEAAERCEREIEVRLFQRLPELERGVRDRRAAVEVRCVGPSKSPETFFNTRLGERDSIFGARERTSS